MRMLAPASPEHTAVTPPVTSSRQVYWLLLGLLWLVIYFAGIFSPALLDDADTVHAEAAREMVLRHDWVTLYANGVRYLEKAPLPYWSVAASYTLFGVSEWSTRLPLMLSVLAAALATYLLGCRCYGERGGFYAALVFLTSLGPYLFTRFLIPDILVGCWLATGTLFFLRTLDEDPPSRFACWGLAAVAALNVLTKGLIGLAFPVGIFGVYLLLTGNLRHILRLRLLSSSAVFLVIAAPWHVLAALRNPAQGTARGFLWFYFVNEHFLRYLNKRFPRDYDTVPLFLFWALLILWLLPWNAFLPQALRAVPWRFRNWSSALDPRRRGQLLFFLWAAVILAFFSFSTRQEYYTVPAIPALALLTGAWLVQEEDSPPLSPPRRAGIISSAFLFFIGVMAFTAAMFLLANSQAPPPGTDLADLLRRNPEDYALSFGHFFDLTPRALGAFRGPLLAAGLALLLGTGLNWLLRRRQAFFAANLALALMMTVLLSAVHSAFVTFNPILSSKTLAVVLQHEYHPGDTLVVLGKYELASTLNFYTGIHLHSLHEPTGNMWYGSLFPDAPRIWETQASLEKIWEGPDRIFVWSEQEHPAALRALTVFEIARSGGKYLYSNRLR
jgi:4-amino-4-deoxy-L-arabinose transferase-like glycosyltransferase